jgi:hypothetical protein
MDVNYLLHRQQVTLIRAQMTRSARGKAAYEDLARGYIDQIDAYRRENERLVNLAH